MRINTKEEFDYLIDRIKKLVIKYEKNVLHYNTYQMYLANGERISFEILPQTVPHLLGIRLDYLKSTGLFKKQDAYDLLKEFLNNSYSIYKQVQEGHLSYHAIFSSHIESKLESFEKNIYFFHPTEIEFVCKYDKSKTYQLGFEKNYPCDYFIVKKGKNGELYILGLICQGNNYMPMSNLLFLKDEEQIMKLKGLLTNQILTYPNAITVDNPVTYFNNTSYLSNSVKLEKIKLLRNYARFIKGIAIDASSDYQYMMNNYQLKDNKLNMYKITCQQLMQTISEHEVFLLDQLDETTKQQMDEEMVGLIETYNNEICKDSSSKAQITYSNLLEQYKTLASQVLGLEQQLEATRQEACASFERMQTLEQENIEYKKFQEEIFSVAKRQREKESEW